MDKIISIVRKNSKIITICALFAAAFFSIMTNVGNFGDSFMSVLGALFMLIFMLALIAAVPLLYVLKKDAYVKYAFVPLFAFWFISTLISAFGNMAFAADGMPDAWVAFGVFEFFIALALLAAVVLYVLYLIKKDKKFLKLAAVVMIGSIVLFFADWIINVVMAAKMDAEWPTYFNDLFNYIAFPIGLIACAVGYFDLGTDENVAVEEPVNDASESQTEEETVEEFEASKSEEAVETVEEAPVIEEAKPENEEVPVASETAEE